MPSTSINDCSIYYEVYGEGIPIVITGGGREPMEQGRPLAEQLAHKYRVILWDRATIGCSDIQFTGPRDLELWATQLSELLIRLDAAPAYLIGPSNGARVSLVTASRYPDVVKGLFLYLISGGSERVAKGLSKLFLDTASAAANGGMEAVVNMDYWSQRILQNPANRGRLLAMDARYVERTLRRWAGAFDPTQVILGLNDDDLARIKTRARVFDVTEVNSPMGRRANKPLADRLTNAEFMIDDQLQADWEGLDQKYGEGAGRYTELPSLARAIDQFVSDFESESRVNA